MKQFYAEVKSARHVLEKQGVRALFARYGWKLVAGIFCYYLFRDLTLYVVLPIFIARMF